MNIPKNIEEYLVGMTEVELFRMDQAQMTINEAKAEGLTSTLAGQILTALVNIAPLHPDFTLLEAYQNILDQRETAMGKTLAWTWLLALGAKQDKLRLLTTQLGLSDPDVVLLWQKYKFTEADRPEGGVAANSI